MPASTVIAYIQKAAAARGLDPRAVLAVAAQEGLGGGIGDNGTSFGPWQLHRGGALPAGIPLSRAHQWAWSQAGINYALDRMASVARGLTGHAAVVNIVSRFERPADPAGEIQRALKAYGLPATANPPATGTAPTMPGTTTTAPAEKPIKVTLPSFQKAQASNVSGAQNDLATYLSGLLPQAAPAEPAAPTPAAPPEPSAPPLADIPYKLPNFMP